MEKKEKILCLFPRFGIGGISKALGFVANCCAEEGYDVYCISMTKEVQTIIFDDRINKIYCTYNVNNNCFANFFIKVWFLLKFRRLIRKISPSIIICFGTDLIRIANISSRFLGIPMIGSERGNPFIYSKKQSKKYIKFLNKCRSIVFQTEGAMNYYPSIIKKKSVIIPNPAIQRFSNNINNERERNNHIVICSRLSPEKRINDIIKAYSISSFLKSNMILNIYGDGPDEKNIKKFISENSLFNNVFLKGNIRNVFEIEKDASLYVLYSEYEGMPNSLIEAMAIGIPSIASNCPPGGVAFVSDNGRRAMLVELGDIIGLSKKMEVMCKDDNLNEYYSKKGIEINEALNYKLIKSKWIQLIENVLNERRKTNG